MTRTGKVLLGSKILKGAVRAFPELEGDALYFLTTDANGLAKVATTCRDAPQTVQNRFWGGLYQHLKRLVLKVKQIKI